MLFDFTKKGQRRNSRDKFSCGQSFVNFKLETISCTRPIGIINVIIIIMSKTDNANQAKPRYKLIETTPYKR